MLSHPFLNPQAMPSIQPMQYHVFISHMQIEASGNVGTMFFMLGEMVRSIIILFLIFCLLHTIFYCN